LNKNNKNDISNDNMHNNGNNNLNNNENSNNKKNLESNNKPLPLVSNFNTGSGAIKSTLITLMIMKFIRPDFLEKMVQNLIG
jgi:hypothetical protein